MSSRSIPRVRSTLKAVLATPANAVAANLANLLIAPADPTRVGLAIYNNTLTGNMYVALSATAASTTFFTRKLKPQEYWEVPLGYTGPVNAIWDVADGTYTTTTFSSFNG